MPLLQSSYTPYAHGEALVAIPEAPEPEETRNGASISGLPLHVLSNVLTYLVDFSLGGNLSQPAYELLSASHVNSQFREACLSHPALWNKVLSLNGIGSRLFEAIVERSGTLSLWLSLREDETLSTKPEVWKILMNNLFRLQFLYVEVNEAHEGIKTTFLLTLLTVDAPALEECVIDFHGRRNVPLNCFVVHCRTPRLRRLRLINCFIPLDRCRFPRLSSIVMHSTDGEPVLSSPYDRLRFHVQFRFLRRLVLWDAVQSITNPILGPPPIELPILETFILLGNGAVCKQLAEVLRIPSGCNRSVTIHFPRDRECVSGDAVVAARAASLFIPNDVEYTACVLEASSTVQTLKLSALSRKPTIKINFLVNNSLRFRASGPIAFLIRAFAGIPPISWLPGFSLTARDEFSFTLWQFLASVCNHTFSSVSLLTLFFDDSSPAPHFFVPLFESMLNVEMAAATAPQVYLNPSFINIVGRQELFPKLTSLGVPLIGNVVDLAYLPQLLWHRRGINHVIFYISPVWSAEMGHDDSDTIRAAGGNLVKEFPEGVEIEWLRN
ncbi:hypothetical protein EST38_g7392 [Candolleomyces aberdarensis]|uniref:Uncharacterized protein n=1 Tax=Candolleomyces aberdarensis TaxID=2316362 RepID=A0A4Q2DHG8_9AGAR|nr:hypothetical protein EST38_g7392 [Candolleomyces aberdarensis]